MLSPQSPEQRGRRIVEHSDDHQDGRLPAPRGADRRVRGRRRGGGPRSPPSTNRWRVWSAHPHADRPVRQLHPRMERGVLLGSAARRRPHPHGSQTNTAATCSPTYRLRSERAQRSSSSRTTTTGQIDLDALANLIDERTQIDRPDLGADRGGLVNPAAEVGRLARAADVLYLLDATQAVGQFPIDVSSASAATCSPAPAASSCAVRAAPVSSTPAVARHRAARSVRCRDPFGQLGRRPVVHMGRRGAAFETWENSYINILGPWRSGRAGSRHRSRLRSASAAPPSAHGYAAGSDAIEGVNGARSGREQCAIVTARVAGVDSGDVADALSRQRDQRQHDGRRAQPIRHDRDVHPLLRLSPHYYNTEAEIDRAVEAVAGLTANQR